MVAGVFEGFGLFGKWGGRAVLGLAGLVALAAAPAAANVNVNVNITTETVYEDFYDSVTLTGPGGGTLTFAGEPGEGWSGGTEEEALAAALDYFGLSLATPLTDIVDTPLESFEVFSETMDNNGAVYGVDYIGDPDDYTTWIAIGLNDVIVDVHLLTTIFTPHALTAALPSNVSEVPLPAGAVLFASALGLGGVFRRKRAGIYRA